MLRSYTFRRCVSTLKEVQSCQEYLDFCHNRGTALSGTVFRGTLYELTVKNLLEKSLNCFNLVRTGGAGDNGLDLFGRWNLAAYLPPPAADSPAITPTKATKSPKPPATSLLSVCKPFCSRKSAVELSQDVVVLVQCKNHKSKVKASTVRELAGIREFHINMASKTDRRRTFMMLVSPLPMTKQAHQQMDTSDVPMLHAQVSALTAPPEEGPGDYLLENWTGGVLGPVYLNASARILLHGLTVESQFSEVVR
ncbi:hypothetical protein JCM33374_g4169 [Metschnikowia sp. JCM 33374]|nr:hypothetical protein JCM33374_g4169 [Metschnikowia sp. JCM 33374]